MFTLRQYLFSVEDPYGLFRTLCDLRFEHDEAGRISYRIGNSAVTFPVWHNGAKHALRCYFRPTKQLRRIYGEAYLERELFLYDAPPHGRWVDVVLIPWIEGEELGKAVREAAEAGDQTTLRTLSEQFDRLALELLRAPWAHGDLKPENILVAPDSTLHLIDRDAMFLPEMQGEHSPELGRAAYQHPRRTAEDFNASMDDFSVALLSSALHALSLDPTLYARYAERDGLLIDTQHLETDEALKDILHLFEVKGLAVRYRIARTLLRRGPSTLSAQPWLELLGKTFATAEGEAPELYFAREGLCGFRTEERIVIPPMFDDGRDFTEGLAAVQLGATWHFIDRHGAIALSLPTGHGVKPFRSGRARVYTEDSMYEIDLAGNRFEN